MAGVAERTQNFLSEKDYSPEYEQKFLSNKCHGLTKSEENIVLKIMTENKKSSFS